MKLFEFSEQLSKIYGDFFQECRKKWIDLSENEKPGQEITARILRAGKPDVVQGNSPQAENPAAWILPAERNGHAGNDSRKKLPYRK